MDEHKNIKKIKSSVKILRKVLSQSVKNQLHKQLFTQDEEKIRLMLSMFKLPNVPKNGTRKIQIKTKVPHPFQKENCEVLLITQDRKKMRIRGDDEPTIKYYKKILKRDNALDLVSEIMPLHRLRTQYKDYEAKRSLANRFDIVLCDETILRRVPLFLGKAFYSKKKRPIAVNLKTKHPSREIKKALSTSIMHIDMNGNSAMVHVGDLSQSDHDIAENISAVWTRIGMGIPGGWKNLQALYICVKDSKSVPIFLSLASRNDVAVPSHPKKLKSSSDFILDDHPLDDTKLIKIYNNGDIYVINKDDKEGKEIEYEESDTEELLSENEDARSENMQHSEESSQESSDE